MNKSAIILLFIILITTHPGNGQRAESKRVDQVKMVIKELFDGYRAGDSSRVSAVFTTEANVQTIFQTTDREDKISELQSVDAFIKYIGGGLEQIHDEKLWDMHISVDEQLATVWSKYVFFLGEKFIHCGTETFLLRKVNDEWKIFYLVDTRQKSGCKLPPEIKK